MIKILVIGSLHNIGQTVGGTVVSLQQLIDFIKCKNVCSVSVIDTSTVKGKWFSMLLNGIFCSFKILQSIPSSDVITLHVGIQALPLIGPVVLLFCWLFKKPIIVRRFGGVDHGELRGLRYLLTDKVVRAADIYLVQTKEMVALANKSGLKNVEWFPTSRPKSLSYNDKTKSCRKFVFLGQIKKSKGIFEIIEAAENFGPDIHVFIYGPFFDGLNSDIFDHCKRVTYCGVVKPEKVSEVLGLYDALLLPTYYLGEGYPGVVLEAFNLGIPVITTTWKAIPEIVDESCGILIPPKDSRSLFDAMKLLAEDQNIYERLKIGARTRIDMFSLERWGDKFVEFCYKSIKEN